MSIPAAAIAEGDTEGCSAFVTPVVDVLPQYDETEYDFSTPMLKIKEIADSSQETVKGSKHTEERPVGLSTGELFFTANYDKLKMMVANGQMACGQVSSVHIVMGFKNNKIYVAKEFPKRSCPYREVLGHEEKHKAVDRQIVEEYSEKIRATLIELTNKIGIIKASSPTIVDDKIDSLMNQAIRKVTKEIDEEHIARQKKVDTKEEYKRVTDSCDGQTMQIVNDRLKILEETHPGSTQNDE
ncbi:MAG: hypothetical protein K2Q32_02980 [Alphaproteobacteria bacterium]|nr:hypothetical protein [Alphaproteobacteria bacterium]